MEDIFGFTKEEIEAMEARQRAEFEAYVEVDQADEPDYPTEYELRGLGRY